MLGQRALVRIYTDEKAKGGEAFGGGSLYNAIVKHASKQGIAGATVLRGVVGFGIDGNVQRPPRLGSQ